MSGRRRTPAPVYRFRRYDRAARATLFGRRDVLREEYLEALANLIQGHEDHLPVEEIIKLERIAIDRHRRQLLGATQEAGDREAVSRFFGTLARTFADRAPKPQRMLPSPVEGMTKTPGWFGRKSGRRQA